MPPSCNVARAHRPGRRALAVAVLAVISSTGNAHQEEEYLEEVLVEGRRIDLVNRARTASEGVVGQRDLEIRPLLRPGDVLETVPGLIVTQHSGSGKSNQMFLRGFNLDHGTDFATWIDGMPVNMRTHGHGQGYTDINFLIPETIASLSFVKGPYHAELGDFSSAGGAHIRTFERMPGNQVRAEIGEYGYQRLLAMGGADAFGGHLSGAIEGQAYDGPWDDIDEDVEKVNGLLRYVRGDEESRWFVTGMYYDNTWNSADQIPERAVRQNIIGDFGSLDTTLGGKSSRHSLSGGWRGKSERRETEVTAYMIDYEMELWSNFTYLLDDPENGDQFEQLDERTIFGADWSTSWDGAEGMRHSVGAGFRHDDIDAVGLFSTRERRRLSTTRLDQVEETSYSAWYELDWQLSHHWRTVLGLRGDYYEFDVDGDIEENAGSDSDSIVSPKASLIYALHENAELYLSGGLGFHSNDARGTTIRIDPGSGEAVDPVDPLVRSRGAEFGLRSSWIDGLNSSIVAWYLELDSELLFVGDAGTTEASRGSRRYGVEFNNFWELNDNWSFEADISWTDAEFDDSAPEGDKIPGALEWVASGAVNARLQNGVFGSFRIRYFGEAPLVEDGSVESDGSLMANLSLGWTNETWRLQLDALNLFDSDDHDIDYFYASRLPGEPADGVEDRHYHIFEPRQFRLRASYLF